MSSDFMFLRANKDKTVFDLRSEVNNHLAPNVTLFSSDNVMVKGHSNILVSCPYFRELFEKDITYKTTNLHPTFNEDLSSDVIELVVKYIYIGEYLLLDPEKLPEVLRATSEEKYNIPELARGYLLKQFDTPGGLDQSNWHIFYKNGIKLNLKEEICNGIYEFLIEKHPKFYRSEEFIGLTFDQICEIMMSPNRPFVSTTTIMEAILIWTKEQTEVGMDKLAELSKICTNLIQFQNINPNPPAAISQILDLSVQSAIDGSLSTQVCPQPTTLSDPHCSSTTRKRTRSISLQIDTTIPNIKRTNFAEVYEHPPKYSWDSAQLLFFDQAKTNEPRYLWSYSFHSDEIKKIAKLPIEDLEDSSLLVARDRIYSIGGHLWNKGYNEQDLVRSFVTNDLENLNKAWDEEPKLTRARSRALTLLFRNTIYLFPKDEAYFISEKWDIDGNPGIWIKNNWDMFYDRDSFGVTLLDNTIYMVGGYGAKKSEIGFNKNSILDTGESYNIEDGTQSLLPNMNQARFNIQMVALEDRIYAIGGYNDDFDELTSVESYKPGDSSWKQVASMNQTKVNGSAFILDDEIYVVGLYDGAPTMERYCPHEDTWTMIDADLPDWAELSSSALLGPSNFFKANLIN